MLQALFDRLRLTYEEDGYDVKEYHLKVQERAQLKADLAQAKAEKEAELAQINEMESEIDFMDAMESEADGDQDGTGEAEGETQ